MTLAPTHILVELIPLPEGQGPTEVKAIWRDDHEQQHEEVTSDPARIIQLYAIAKGRA